ncbi:MAG: hypothetical protein ACRCZS_02395 [Chroococcidiopsis sp.]
MNHLTVDTYYYDRLRRSQHDFAAANITALTVIKSRPPLIIAILLWLRYKIRAL